jgi:hypothetical protein
MKNPALSYISMPEENEPNRLEDQNEVNTNATNDFVNNQVPPKEEKKNHKKSKDTQKFETEEEITEIPTMETKSKRAHYLIYPSLDEDITRIAKMKGMKPNNLVNIIFKEYTSTPEALKLIEAHKRLNGEL